jgi:hypothetical protein
MLWHGDLTETYGNLGSTMQGNGKFTPVPKHHAINLYQLDLILHLQGQASQYQCHDVCT